MLQIETPGRAAAASTRPSHLALSARAASGSTTTAGIASIGGCTVSHGVMGALATGIDVAVGVPATVTLEHDAVAAPGTAIRLTTTLASGAATLAVIGSRATTFTPSGSVVGIGVDVRGAGTVTTYLYSNVVHGVGGAGSGRRAGISIRTADATGSAAVNV
jgi:hypothetical protein